MTTLSQLDQVQYMLVILYVITTVRGHGYGALIMSKAIDLARLLFPHEQGIFIESQATKQGFYEKLGFIARSEPFMMEGLLHLNMWLDLK